MRFGLDVAQHHLTWEQVRDRALLAEEVGFDSVWVMDHFGPLFGDRRGQCLEGWSLLAGLAAVTQRVRLGTLVTGITYRHPSVLAAQAVTVDHVSEGRLDIGLGAAWRESEHQELGIDFPRAGERIERLGEAIEVLRTLMTEDGGSFDGRYYRLEGATYRPRPVQTPYPPLWIGGGGERKLLPLAARVADYWHGFGNPGAWERKSQLLDQYAEEAGRDPSEIGRSSSLWLSRSEDGVRRQIERFAEKGCTHLVVQWPSGGRAQLEEFAEHTMASVRS